MARLMAAADGNFTSSGTWVTVDAATALVTEGGAGRTALSTTVQNSANITPTSNITIDGIAVKIMDVSGATGNLVLTLYNVTSTSSVVSLTVPLADLPIGSNAVGTRTGWMLFATGDQNLTSGSNYQVRCNLTTGSSSMAMYTNGTAANWQHMFRTKTAAAPASGDDLWILGLWTGSGTWTAYTVTMDSVSDATTYGSNPTGGTAEERHGLCIGKGTLRWGTSASTNYALKLAGNILVYNGGTYEMGSAGTPVPDTSTATLTFATTTGFAIIGSVGSTINIYGSPRSAGKNINWTYLTADMTSGSTSTASVAHDTGWKSGDGIYIASSTTTWAQSAPYTLGGDATSSSLPLTGAASANYDGDGLMPTSVILTSYNVVVQSDNAARACAIEPIAATVLSGQWFKLVHGALDYSNAVTGAQTLRYVCLHNIDNLTLRAAVGNASHTGTWSIRDLTLVTTAAISNVFTVTPGSGGVVTGMTFEDWVGIIDHASGGSYNITNGNYASLKNFRCHGGGLTIAAGSYSGFTGEPTADFLSGSIVFGGALGLPTIINWTLSNARIGGSAQFLTQANAMMNVTFESCYFLANSTTYVIGMGTATKFQNVVFSNCFLGNWKFLSGANVPTHLIAATSAMDGPFDLAFLNCTFADANLTCPGTLMDLAAIGDPTALSDLSVALVNCLGEFTAFASATTPSFTRRSVISVHRNNQTSGDHRLIRPYAAFGRCETDAATYNTAAPSEKLTPLTASIKLESTVKRCAIVSGGTAAISVYVRKSAAYNGNAPRLMMRRNDAAGVTADTVGDTHTAAADTWEQLTYTTPAVSDDAVLEFYVDCDGTAGVVYVDDWAAA